MEQDRNLSIDIARGIGIILVILGHTVAQGSGHKILHGFTSTISMPLFFGMAGIYISDRVPFVPFVKSKLIRFVIPFLSWVAVYFLLSMAMAVAKVSLQSFVNVNQINQPLDPQTLMSIFTVPVMANWYALKNAGVVVELWFLPAVFSVIIIYRLLYQFLKRQGTRIVLLPIAIFVSFSIVYLNNRYHFHDNVPWSIDIAVICLPFLIICRYHSYMYRLHWLTIPFLMFATYYFSRDAYVRIAGLIIEPYTLFFATALSGVILIFQISARLQSSWAGSVLSVIGKRSYLIYLLQGLVFMIVKPVMSRLPLLGTNETVFNYAVFLAVLIAGCLLYPFFEKYRYLKLFALGEGEKRRNNFSSEQRKDAGNIQK